MHDPSALAEAFLSHPAGRDVDHEGPAMARLGAELAARLDAARNAWPAFAVDPVAFVMHLARHTRKGRLPPDRHTADLYLAFACSEGSREALKAFEGPLSAAVRDARIDRQTSLLDEVVQKLRESLLLTQPPKIGEYAGVATLRSWLRTCATRTALNLQRRKGDSPRDRAAFSSGAIPIAATPELDYLRERYREQFADAVRDSLGALTPRERLLLKLHLGDGASIDKLAALFRVGRSTAARWLVDARRRLEGETRSALRGRLGLTDSEYESLAAILRSEIHVSVVRALADDPLAEGQ
jgi:RNA polymerase sigma-70 factor (ECF subfamily)